jgi:hypothetical protein
MDLPTTGIKRQMQLGELEERCIRRKPRDGTTRGSRRNLSNREIRYYSLTLALNFLVMESLEVNGMAPSQF